MCRYFFILLQPVLLFHMGFWYTLRISDAAKGWNEKVPRRGYNGREPKIQLWRVNPRVQHIQEWYLPVLITRGPTCQHGGSAPGHGHQVTGNTQGPRDTVTGPWENLVVQGQGQQLGIYLQVYPGRADSGNYAGCPGSKSVFANPDALASELLII